MGIPYPVFLLTLENQRVSELVVTAIVYRVWSIGQVKGRIWADRPKVTYVHKLDYKVGDQRHNLDRPFHVAPNSASSFALQLWTDHPDLGMTWAMSVRLETNQGTIETDRFQLIMSGEPEWHKGKFK